MIAVIDNLALVPIAARFLGAILNASWVFDFKGFSC